MQNIEYAVISAAGLVQINGRMIIDYQLELLKHVPNIRIVVGFMEEKVIEHVRTLRDDVLFVRNPDFNTTTNSYSLWLGSYDIPSDFLAVDGDLLIPKKSFNNFLSKVKVGESLIGVTKSKTEDAVFVDYREEDSSIHSFSRKKNYGYEWTGLAYISGMKIEKSSRYVFNILEKHLPLKACEIDCYEIDTPGDLDITRKEFKF